MRAACEWPVETLPEWVVYSEAGRYALAVGVLDSSLVVMGTPTVMLVLERAVRPLGLEVGASPFYQFTISSRHHGNDMIDTHGEYVVLNNLLERGLYVFQVLTPSPIKEFNIISHPLLDFVPVVLNSRVEGVDNGIPRSAKVLVGNTLGGHV